MPWYGSQSDALSVDQEGLFLPPFLVPSAPSLELEALFTVNMQNDIRRRWMVRSRCRTVAGSELGGDNWFYGKKIRCLGVFDCSKLDLENIQSGNDTVVSYTGERGGLESPSLKT